MKKLVINTIIVILFTCMSCDDKRNSYSKDERVETGKVTTPKDSISTDSAVLQKKPASKEESIPSIIINKPCPEILKFVADIESLTWVSDVKRLNKVGIYQELDRSRVKYFNERPFYPISFDNSRLGKACNRETFRDNYKSLDIELFKNAKSVWGYFYRERGATNTISDGVIEQWEFENETQAHEALTQISDSGFTVYFNTNPYFCRIENKLIIFQARAMVFSYDQEAVFQKFAKEKGVITLY